jgi:hypothetical protein
VAIVAYDMQRQIERTLRSLSPSMQWGMRADEYELIVVDNGSPRALDREACEAQGAPLRWLRLDDASPSPAAALNRGIAEASAPLVGAMIDGARMASPGLLANALVAARVHHRPVVGSHGFHLGEEPQQRAVRTGYDEAAEERLLAEVEWERDGYRLFDIAAAGLSSREGWVSAPAESNALFMPAPLWEEVGGFDERFASPGGGLVNLDLFARACELPDSRLVMLIGEGTFHQVHGGVTTNDPDARFEDLQAEFERIRGRGYRRPSAKPLLVGSPRPNALAALPFAV